MSLAKNDYENWFPLAACSGDMGVLFYPPLRTENRAARNAREARAKAVCATCSVREPCLDLAIERDERYGIWGGLTDLERRRLNG